MARRSASSSATEAFSECFARYQECLEYRDWQSSASLHEEVENYILDFELAAKKALSSDATLWQLFRFKYVEQRTGGDCARALKMDPFTLGRTTREVKTLVGEALIRRGLFPLNRYFNSGATQTSEFPANRTRLAA